MRRCESPWLLVVDADEFVVGDRPASEALAAVPDGVDALWLPVAEAVWGPGDDLARDYGSSHFRRPLGRALAKAATPALYGRHAPLFRRGVLGHTDGKSFRAPRRRLRHGELPPPPPGGAPPWAVPRGRPRPPWRRSGWPITTPSASSGGGPSGAGGSRGEADVPNASMQRRALTASIAAELDAGEDRARRLFAQLFALSRPQAAALRLIGGLERPAGAEALRPLREPVALGGDGRPAAP